MIPDQVKALSKSYPPPSEEKLERCINGLERMAKFYRAKAPDSKDGGALFNQFVSNLMYASTVIKMHRKLTGKLAELAADDGRIET